MRGRWSRLYIIMFNHYNYDEWIKWGNGQEWNPCTQAKYDECSNAGSQIRQRRNNPQLLKALTISEISKSWPIIAKVDQNGQCRQYDQELLKNATSPSECCKQHYNDNCDEKNFLVRCQIVCKCLSALYNGTTTAKDLNCGPGRIQRQRFRSHAALELTSCPAFCSLVPTTPTHLLLEVRWGPCPAFCHFRSSVATLLGTEVSLSLAFVILLVLRAVHRTYGFPSCTSICLTLSTSSLVRRWLKFRTVLRWSRRWRTRTFSYQTIKEWRYASKATCKTMCHLECVNIWTTRSCRFDWMSLQKAGQGFRSSDRAAVFGVCGGRWSDRSRYNWLTIDQDGGSLGNSPSPHVVSPSQTNCLPFHFWTKGSSTSCQEWNP